MADTLPGAVNCVQVPVQDSGLILQSDPLSALHRATQVLAT